MFKKILAILILSILGIGVTYAQVNNDELVDYIEGQAQSGVANNIATRDDYKLNYISSCSDMSSYIRKLIDQGGYRYPMPMAEGMVKTADVAVSSVSSTVSAYMGGYSDINNQVKNVFESDISRSNGKYMFYYNNTKNVINIVSLPNKTTKAELVKVINLPKGMAGGSLQLQGNKLIIIASKYNNMLGYRGYNPNTGSFLSDNGQTIVAIYDITDIYNSKLSKVFQLTGSIMDNRLIGSKLYIFGRNIINPYRLSDLSDQISKNTGFNISDKLQNINLDCNKMMITSGVASDVISNITTIDLENNTTKIQTIAGDISSLYVDNDNIYTIQTIYKDPYYCPPYARCVQPTIYITPKYYSNISKRKINTDNIEYMGNNLTEGSIYNSYWMHEYQDQFVILTQTASDDGASDSRLTKFSSDMNTMTSIKSIKKGENVMSVRYINNRAYIVTYRQIDPLFLIDLDNMKILGELKIPGFSQYLHPYGVIDGKQYLIGLGTEADNNGTIKGLKVDLYEVDETSNKISIKQKFTQTIGGKGSYSEATYNPRMFVRDTMRSKLLIPINRSDNVCNSNSKTKEITCNYKTLFNGYKSISINHKTGIKALSSMDYQKFMNMGYYSSRVGYIGDTIYYISDAFVDFYKTAKIDF